LPIFFFNIFGSSSIGIYFKITEKFFIMPPQVLNSKINDFNEFFEKSIVRTTIGNSVLIGSLVCANSNGIILPYYVEEKELFQIRSILDIAVVKINSKKTAFGNLVLANDYGAIISPQVSKANREIISDVLQIEVQPGKIAGLTYVGSLALATNKGVMAHPMIKPEEEELIRDLLKVHVGVGTVSCGIPYISTGLIGNSQIAITSFLTTGPELFMIDQALKVAD
jgi:translation initiation factor 6